MKKKIIFYNQIDYLFEAFQTLGWFAEGKNGSHSLEKLKETVLRKYEADSEQIQKCLVLEEKIWKRMNVSVKGKEKQIRDLFGELENDISPAKLVLCGKALMPLNGSPYRDTRELMAAYEQLSREEKDAYFFLRLTRETDRDTFEQYIGGSADGMAKTDAERICNIFSYIQNMNIKQENKLRFQDIYLNRDQYFEQVMELMEETVQILKEYEDEFLELFRVWKSSWGKIVEEGIFFEKMKGFIEIDDSMIENGCCLMPSFIEPISFWLHIDDNLIPEKKKYMTLCRLGIILTDHFGWEYNVKEEFRADELVPICKALGDKSKMDILLFIKDKPAYGSEIAKQFSLTTATVSHHMNKMLQLRLVQADLRDGKVYYRANKEMLQEFLEHAKQMFS